MHATTRWLSAVSATSSARRRLIRNVRPAQTLFVNPDKAQPARRSLLRRCLRWCGALLIVYVLSYGVLSATGGWVVNESGEHRIITAVSDQFQWQPRYGSCQRFRSVSGDYTLRADALGYFYAPLILLDQGYIHPTISFLDPDGLLVPFPAPPLADYHPLRSSSSYGKFPYQ